MSEQRNESDSLNFIKLQMLIKQTCIVLRDVFCQRWEVKYGQKWEDIQDRGNQLITGFGRDVYNKAGKLQKKNLQKGDINNLDVTTLCQLLQMFGEKKIENKMIRTIVEVRNKIAHHATQEMDTNEFESQWQALGQALLYFGFSESKLKEFYSSESIHGINLSNPKNINQESITEAKLLKEQANEAFKSQNYTESIRLYSDAVELPDLPDDVLGILYSNRSSAYLKLSTGDDDNIQKARDDAKLAINCRPTWWKAYYRLGCVYEGRKKHEKAIVQYNKSLSLDPSQLQVRSERDGCRDDLAIMQRREHLDPQQMPLSREECMRKITQRSFNNISADQVEKVMSMARKIGDPFLIAAADVYLAHQYLTGMDDVRQSYSEAAKLFSKAAAAGNAEAIYNLAILTKHGHGVKRHIPMAIQLFRQASALPPKLSGMTNVGVAEAQHSLGLCFADGVGVDPNPFEALKWYEKSCENGCSAAANNLGLIYAHGVGVPANFERAIQYWEVAAAGGSVIAMESLEMHYLKVSNSKRAKHWWQCALKIGSVTAAQREELHANSSRLDDEISDLGSDSQILKNVIDDFAIKMYSNSRKQSPLQSGFSSFPDFPYLRERARDSITAQKLITAFHHLIKGMDLFAAKKDHVKMIHEFAESYRAEYIVPRWDPDEKEELQQLIALHLKTLTTQPEPSDFELDLRVCYVSLRFVAMEEMLEFSEVSIKRFPNETYLYDVQQCILGFVERYSEGLKKCKLSLKRFPTCIPLLYNNAVHTRLSNGTPQQTIDAYKRFLEMAPRDHRKVPECYYVMASCYLQTKDIDSVRRFYDLGLVAEKEQLSCFLPYKSNTKDFLSNLFQFESSMSKLKERESEQKISNSAANSASSKSFIDCISSVKNSKPTMTQLTNPHRIQLTIAHREWILATGSTKQKISSTTQAKQTSKFPANLVGLKPITFNEMDITKDHVYEGYVLQATNVEDAAVGGSSIVLILADDNHDVQRCFVYNFSQNYRADEIQKKLGFGCSFSILNPYMRMATDMKPAIRIDDPRSLINNTLTDDELSQSKKCRFCFAVDNLKSCARCKRVWYCSKECQSQDWTLLKHKIICEPNIL